MSPEILREQTNLGKAVPCFPSILIIMPFEPKMSIKAELEHRIKELSESIWQRLKTHESRSEAKLVGEKLKTILLSLNYSTYKQSLAIFVSPQVEKIYYLDIPVEEKVIIDQAFEIRDLIYSKKDIHKYLILVLSANRSRTFLGNTSQFIRITSNTPEHAAAFDRDIPQRVANFSDPSARKEVMLDKFLRHVDKGLDIILKAYAIPLFVMGTERTLGHFKKITHHLDRISGYVHGNFEEATENEVWQAIIPLIADWKKVKELDLRQQLELARGAGKLTYGIQEVADAANHKRGRLLVVEKNYMHLDPLTDGNETTLKTSPHLDAPCYSKDVVDDVIEMVLENGGDVEFVDGGVLPEYNHIALTLFY